MWFISCGSSQPDNPTISWQYHKRPGLHGDHEHSQLPSKSLLTFTNKVYTDNFFSNQLYNGIFTLSWYYCILQNNADPPWSCSTKSDQERNATKDNYQDYFNGKHSPRDAWFLSVVSCAFESNQHDGVALHYLDGSSVEKGIDTKRCIYAREKDWPDWKVHSWDQYFHTKIMYS